MLYYVEYLDVVEVSSLFPVKGNTLEALQGEVIFHSQRLVLSSIYRPPNSADFYAKLEKQLDGVCRRRKNFMEISNLNANLQSIRGHSEVTYANANGRLITKVNVCVLKEFGHVNVITQPTRISNRVFKNSYRKQQKQGRKSQNFRHW